MNATVYKSTGNWYQVKDDEGNQFNARLLGKFKMDGLTSTNPIAVGDSVNIEMENELEGSVTNTGRIYKWLPGLAGISICMTENQNNNTTANN